MSHAVEKMAYANAVPWHGLGTKVDENISLDDMLVEAGLDWRVERVRVAIENPKTKEWEHSPEHQAVVRDSDGKIFDVTSKGWIPVQNKDSFEFFRAFCDAGQIKMETAGSLRDGRIIWGLANIVDEVRLKDGDTLKGYILLANSHAAGQALTVRPTFVRVVCANTLSAALGAQWGTTNAKRTDNDRTFAMRHTREFDEAARNEARDAIGIARDDLSRFGKMAAQLKKVGMTRETIVTMLAPIYCPKVEVKDVVKKFDEHASNALVGVMNSYENAPGAEVGTAWGALNAVTHFEDHVFGHSPSTRLSSNWLGIGRRRKANVVEALLELAA